MNPEGNCEITVGECLAKIARQPKVKTTDYLESGAFPVIDQGTKFVGGYVNDESLLYTGPLPVVIFGDHNRHIKFVKSPFAVGADGTQLLYPDERFDISYFYYAVRALPLKNYGYERHFKYLKEERLRVWPLDVQRRIAAILSAYDDLIENNTRRIAILEEMARRIYEEWFVRFRFPGHEGVRMVESEKGLVPEGWPVVRLDDVLVLQRGFDLPKQDRTEGPFPIISATGASASHHEYKVKGPGVVTGRSGSLGTVMYVEGDFWPLNTTLWVKQFAAGSPLYAFYVLQSIDLVGFNSGAAVPTLNRNDVHGLPVVRPTTEVLSAFDEVVGPMIKLKRRLELKNENLRTTRDFLLPKLISGELDVSAMPEQEVLAA